MSAKQRLNSSVHHMLVNWLNIVLSSSSSSSAASADAAALKLKSIRDLKDAVVFTKLSVDLLKKSFTELAEVYRQMPELANDVTKRFECVSTVVATQLDIKSGINFDLAADANEFELAKVSVHFSILIDFFFLNLNVLCF